MSKKVVNFFLQSLTEENIEMIREYYNHDDPAEMRFVSTNGFDIGGDYRMWFNKDGVSFVYNKGESSITISEEVLVKFINKK